METIKTAESSAKQRDNVVYNGYERVLDTGRVTPNGDKILEVVCVECGVPTMTTETAFLTGTLNRCSCRDSVELINSSIEPERPPAKTDLINFFMSGRRAAVALASASATSGPEERDECEDVAAQALAQAAAQELEAFEEAPAAPAMPAASLSCNQMQLPLQEEEPVGSDDSGKTVTFGNGHKVYQFRLDGTTLVKTHLNFESCVRALREASDVSSRNATDASLRTGLARACKHDFGDYRGFLWTSAPDLTAAKNLAARKHSLVYELGNNPPNSRTIVFVPDDGSEEVLYRDLKRAIAARAAILGVIGDYDHGKRCCREGKRYLGGLFVRYEEKYGKRA